MKLLIIDNNDSFTYNLVQLVREFHGIKYTVKLHNEIVLAEVRHFDKILFSPGPSLPKDYPILNQILDKYGKEKSILGVCLGLQCIAEFYGGQLFQLRKVVHGRGKQISIQKRDFLFNGLPDTFKVGLYHSWSVIIESLPDCLEISSISENGNIMSIFHKSYNIRAVQFHPESIITEFGQQLINNWLVN